MCVCVCVCNLRSAAKYIALQYNVHLEAKFLDFAF